MGPSNDTLIVKLTKQRPRNECLISYLHIIDSQYIVVQYNTILHTVNTINLKRTLVRLRTHERQPNIALMGELWVPFVSYLEKIDQDILEVHCIWSVGYFQDWEALEINLITPVLTLVDLKICMLDCLKEEWNIFANYIIVWHRTFMCFQH